MKYLLHLFQRLSGWGGLTVIMKKKSNVLSLQKFFSIPVFSVAVNAVDLYPSQAASKEHVTPRQCVLLRQTKWGIALPPVPDTGILLPLVPGIGKCSVTSLCSLRSLVEPSLCSGTSNCLVITSASSQMSSFPHWYPFCCHPLYSLIVNLPNFNVLCLQQFGRWMFLHVSMSQPCC